LNFSIRVLGSCSAAVRVPIDDQRSLVKCKFDYLSSNVIQGQYCLCDECFHLHLNLIYVSLIIDT
jgi:hypothetical protein